MRIAVITADDFLWCKISLALKNVGLIAQRITEKSFDVYDVCIYDADNSSAESVNANRVISVARGGACDLTVPFSFTDLRRAVSLPQRESAPLRLGDKCAYLSGTHIPLTDVEYRLLKLLYDAGDFVSRDELLNKVWGGECDGGVLNVYIHYLREKLEKGEKIILSSRKNGYRIDPRFLTEKAMEGNGNA